MTKSRLVTDFPDTPDRCLPRPLSTSPRLGASRAASGASSAEAGPRWGGAETKHTVQVQQSFGRSSARSARTRHLALDCSRDALDRVFHRHRGVSRNRSRPRWTKTLALRLTESHHIVSTTICAASAPVGLEHHRWRWWVSQVYSLEWFCTITGRWDSKVSDQVGRRLALRQPGVLAPEELPQPLSGRERQQLH